MDIFGALDYALWCVEASVSSTCRIIRAKFDPLRTYLPHIFLAY